MDFVLSDRQRRYLDENPDHRLVWDLVRRRESEDRAITRDELEGETGFNDRYTRILIHELTSIAGLPVVPRETAPGGYYLGQPEDIEIAVDKLRKKRGALSTRIDGLERARTQYYFGPDFESIQAELEFTEPPKHFDCEKRCIERGA